MHQKHPHSKKNGFTETDKHCKNNVLRGYKKNLSLSLGDTPDL